MCEVPVPLADSRGETLVGSVQNSRTGQDKGQAGARVQFTPSFVGTLGRQPEGTAEGTVFWFRPPPGCIVESVLDGEEMPADAGRPVPSPPHGSGRAVGGALASRAMMAVSLEVDGLGKWPLKPGACD